MQKIELLTDLGKLSSLSLGKGWTEMEEKKEKKKHEEIPHMCDTIGDRPFQGRCPASSLASSTTYLGRARVPLTM